MDERVKHALENDRTIDITTQGRNSGEPQRIDRYEGRAGQVVERLTSFGYGTATAAPVKFGGKTWGALVAAGPHDKPFPPGSERRLTDFADLVAQALANADAYRKLAASRVRIVEAADHPATDVGAVTHELRTVPP